MDERLTEQVMVRVPMKLMRLLKRIAKKERRPLGQICRHMIEKKLGIK